MERSAAHVAKMEKNPIQTIDNGKYTDLDLIGEGGIGVVYRALQVDFNRVVALKVLNQAKFLGPEFQARFARESVVLGKLKHKNIVSVYSIGYDSDTQQSYLSMEFLSGKTLRQALSRSQNGRLDLTTTLTIMIQVVEALGYAHSSGVVHRDLKPENIMIMETPEPNSVKLLDFGLAKILKSPESAQKLTQTGVIVGSINYMSPEQCKGKAVDERSDIYAVGCVLYECLSSHPPFESSNPLELLQKHINEFPEKLIRDDNSKNLPVEIELIIWKAIQKDPAKRFQSMAELEESMRRLLAGQSPDLTLTELEFYKPKPSNKSEPHNFALMMGTVLVLLLGLFSAVLYQKSVSVKSKVVNAIAAKHGDTQLERAESLCSKAEQYKQHSKFDLSEDYLCRAILAVSQRTTNNSDHEILERRALVLQRLATVVDGMKLKNPTNLSTALAEFQTKDLEQIDPLLLAKVHASRAKLYESAGNYQVSTSANCLAARLFSHREMKSEAKSAIGGAKHTVSLAPPPHDLLSWRVRFEEALMLAEHKENIQDAKKLGLQLESELGRIFPEDYSLKKFTQLLEMALFWDALEDYSRAETNLLKAYSSAKLSCKDSGNDMVITNQTYPLQSGYKLVDLYKKTHQFERARAIINEMEAHIERFRGLPIDNVGGIEKARRELDEAELQALEKS